MRHVLIGLAAILSLLMAVPAPAAETPPALPTYPWEETCRQDLPPEAGFSTQERWAWTQRLCLGLEADMSEFSDDDGAGCNPNKADNWPETRVLSE